MNHTEIQVMGSDLITGTEKCEIRSQLKEELGYAIDVSFMDNVIRVVVADRGQEDKIFVETASDIGAKLHSIRHVEDLGRKEIRIIMEVVN